MIDYIQFKELTADIIDVLTLNKLNQKLIEILEIEHEHMTMMKMFISEDKFKELSNLTLGTLAEKIVEMQEDQFNELNGFVAIINELIQDYEDIKKGIDKIEGLNDVEKELLFDYVKAFLKT
jgi:hypothetical protein